MRFSHFFIDRPIFAAAVSVVITLTGLISYLTLPVDQYPQVAPPTVSVSALYPGATAEEIADTVAAPIEQQINGIADMLYMSSAATNEGRVSITVTFKNGTNVDIAQVDVQNRIQSVLPQLPQTVRDLGITVRKGSTDILLIVHMFATDSSVDRKYIANYANLQVRERLLRTPGVGDVNVNAARDYAMRVWIDPDRAAARDLTVQEIVEALRNNNVQVAGGAIGSPPFNDNPAAYQLSIRAQGRLETPEEFSEAIIKRDTQGRVTRIDDVARVELGAQNYTVNAYKSLSDVLQFNGATGCDRAQQAGLRCLFESGTWNNLRQLNRPAIIELTDSSGARHHVLITALKEDSVSLELGDRLREVPLSDVNQFWYGKFLSLWKPPESGDQLLIRGMRSPAIVWLRDALARANVPVAQTAEQADIFDADLEAKVKEFQRRHQIEDDGLVGQMTLVLLTNYDKASPPLLANSETVTAR